MHTEHLYARKTHRYVDTYRHLDRRDFVAAVRVTPPRQVREPESYDDGGDYIVHVRAPAAAADKNLSQALRDTLSYQGCHHEYDCCGCKSQRASVRRIGRRDYVVRLSVGFNY